MERKSFLKSLLVLVAAPKVISKIDFNKTELKSESVLGSTSNLFNDMNAVVPYYLEKLHERYSYENYSGLLETLKNNYDRDT